MLFPKLVLLPPIYRFALPNNRFAPAPTTDCAHSVVHADHLIELPDKMTYEEGAGVAEGFLTAYQALFFIGDLKQYVAKSKAKVIRRWDFSRLVK